MNESSDFEEWHRGPRQSQAGGESTSGREDVGIADVWGDASEPVPYRRSRRPDWLAPVLVIAVATLAFAGAWFLTRGGDPASDASGSPLSVATSSASPDSTAVPSTPSNAPTSPSSSSPPSSRSDEVVSAPFPANAVATCGGGQSVPTSSVRLASGTSSTCSYVGDVVNKVNAHLTTDAAATSFTIQPYSETLRRVVPLTCSRERHLSYCTGGTNVRLWVSDSVR